MPVLTEIAAGVLVATSEFDVTTTTVVTGPGGRCLVIDPGVTVAELAALSAELAALGLRPQAGWSTHPHWDHVLWHRELGEVPRFAAPAAVTVARTHRAALLDEAGEAAPGHDPDTFARLTALPPSAAEVPWDGPRAQVVVHEGHAPGHGAVFLPGTGTLVAGDMCSDVEIPLLDLDSGAPDPVGDYRTGLQQLAALAGVRQLVPGHGHVGDATEFRRRVAADRAYLGALEREEPFTDPRLIQPWLVEQHARQLRHARR